MSNRKQLSRRTLLQTAVTLAPIALTGCASATRKQSVENEPLLRAPDPVARALAYYPDTREVPADNPLAGTHDASQKCSNCIHRLGSAGPGLIECPMFPGRRVSEDGWCSVWAQS